MGWHDRDWARWTDDERAGYLGSSTGIGHHPGTPASRRGVTLLAMLVSLGLSLVTWQFHLFRFSAHRLPAQAPQPAVVYGTGLAHFNGQSPEEMTCTAMAVNAQGTQSCTTWTFLSPGQQAVQAATLPAGTSCTAVEADQHTGRWVCTARASSGAAT